MLISSPSARTNTTSNRRLWIIMGCVVLGVAILLALQYTRFRLLPERKTATLWGVLIGLLAMLFAPRRWR